MLAILIIRAHNARVTRPSRVLHLLFTYSGEEALAKSGRADSGIPSHSKIVDAILGAGLPELRLSPRAGTLTAPLARKAAASAASEASLPEPRRALLEGLVLLWHDRWEEAHEAAQAREGDPDFDLLHAIGHRREGDYPNALYWFDAAGKHPCYALLAPALSAPVFAGIRESLLPRGEWSPAAFVAEVKRHAGEVSERRTQLVLAQAAEMRSFIEWIFV
jgi:hypothetical protein